MKKSLASLVALFATAVALTTLSAPAARAQGQDQVILTARADAEPFVLAFVDSGGQSQVNEQLSDALQKQFASSDWSLTNKGQLTISKDGKGLTAARFLTNTKQTWFIVHQRSAQGSVDGTIWKYSNEPTKGASELILTLVSQDGKSIATIYLSTELAFTTPGGGGTGEGGFGGFGN
jgi:hypothetical protein